MAFVRTENYTANDGSTYADVAAWQAAHGETCLAGGETHNYVGAHTLLADGKGVQVVLTYTTEADHTAHMAQIATDNPGVDTSVSWASTAATTGTFVSAA
jgi:glycerate-2-kinase